jgi:hypothetical protein
MIVSGYQEGNQEDRLLAGTPTLPFEGRVSSSSICMSNSNSICAAYVTEKCICYSG